MIPPSLEKVSPVVHQQIVQASIETISHALNTIEDGFLIADPYGKIIYYNQTAAQYLGDHNFLDKEQWTSMFSVFHLDHLSEPMEFGHMPVFRALQGEEFEDYRIFVKSLMRPHGVYLSCNGKPIVEGGTVVSAVITFRDITRIVHYEKKLLRQKTFFQKFFEHLPAMAYMRDLKGHFVYSKKDFNEFFNLSLVLGKRLDDVLPLKYAQEIFRHDEKILKEKKEVEFKSEVELDDGRVVNLITVQFPLLAEDGEILSIGGILFLERADNK